VEASPLKDDENKDDREEQKIFGDQDVDITVGKGIGNALKYFSQRGMLGAAHFQVENGQQISSSEQPTTDVILGRTNDKSLAQQLQSHGLSGDQENDKVNI
jgi:hypothetical protein